MEKRKLLFNSVLLALFGFVLVSLFTFIGCSNDDENPPEDETLAGIYKMSEAILTSDVVDAKDSVVMPAGTDVTQIMAGGIFGASPCDDPANSAIEMRDDGKLYFICTGSESSKQGVDAGSWSENSTMTELTLSLNSTVVPPLGFELTIINVNKTGGVVSGNIPGVPLPATLLNQVFPDITFDAFQTVGANVKFPEVSM